MQNELERFEQALLANMSAFAIELSPDPVALLGTYYSLLTRWNARLHLVAPCSPEEFATRHVLESLILLEHLPQGAKIADVGSGGGLPIIPCLIARPDLEATLIESSQKKTVFLREALAAAGRGATIVARRFEDIDAPQVEFVTSRALDEFLSKLPGLIKWAPKGATLLLFGGEQLKEKLPGAEARLIPGSERRYLLVARINADEKGSR
ncbi:MAG TPA: 16S rRNA (guanine(527)-N(7))-methyltransferase RsmG [Pyrinomonadaceae bacterium]|nr:16S rRNA (guanine(527)-N(7))-methyltransferase RsmG [Pyrinomonadaceae bacterium]